MDKEMRIADDMAEIVMEEDAHGTLLDVNEAFCKCFGISAEEARGRSVFDFILPQDRERCNVEDIVTPENPYYRIEGRSKRADGKIIWLQYIGKAYYDENGERKAFHEIAVDITEWKERIDESAKKLAKANEWIEKMAPFSFESETNRRINRKNGRFSAMHHFSDIVTRNKSMKELISYAEAIAPGNATVLIEGESGTGKELFAQAIHNKSLRAAGPFVAVNCGAIPENLIESEFFGYVEGAFTGAVKGGRAGKFEQANGGTLFLDEIGEMPLSQQVALLRVLETKRVSRIGGYVEIPVDVRIICATNTNLKKAVEGGRFRKDLYYRLNVINLKIPPLRERKDDVLLLMGAFIRMFGRHRFDKEIAFRDEHIIALYEYDWPGNVREVQNIVERMMYIPAGEGNLIANTILEAVEQQREKQNRAENSGARCDVLTEKDQVIKLREDCEGNISMMARKMGVSRNTMYRRIKKYENY